MAAPKQHEQKAEVRPVIGIAIKQYHVLESRQFGQVRCEQDGARRRFVGALHYPTNFLEYETAGFVVLEVVSREQPGFRLPCLLKLQLLRGREFDPHGPVVYFRCGNQYPPEVRVVGEMEPYLALRWKAEIPVASQ